MAILIGTAPVSWGSWKWRRSGNALRPSTWRWTRWCSAGYSGTELGSVGLFLPTDPKQSHGAKLSCRRVSDRRICPDRSGATGTSYSRESSRRSDRAPARWLRRAGWWCWLTRCTSAGWRSRGAWSTNADGLSDRQWEAAATFGKGCPQVNALGVRAAFHHHAGTYVETPRRGRALLSSTDPSYWPLSGHGTLFLRRWRPVEVARRYAARIWHVHLKDIRATCLIAYGGERIGFLDAVSQGVFCELGAGSLICWRNSRLARRAATDGGRSSSRMWRPGQPGVEPLKSAARSRNIFATPPVFRTGREIDGPGRMVRSVPAIADSARGLSRPRQILGSIEGVSRVRVCDVFGSQPEEG